MKILQIFFSVLFALLLIKTQAIAQYTLTNDDVRVVNGMISSCTYDFSITDIIISDTLDGQEVIGIYSRPYPNGVFKDRGLTSIVLPTTIKYIGDRAFENNLLDSLDLSGFSALTYIGSSAFSSNNITSLSFDSCEALTQIESMAFYNNNIFDIDLSNCSTLVYIGSSAFMNNLLTSFNLPLYTNNYIYGWEDNYGNIYNSGENITNLELSYFIPEFYTLTDSDVEVTNGIIQSCSYSFNIQRIVIPDTLDGQKVIGIADKDAANGVFRYKGIKSVIFPSTIERIGNYAFYYCVNLINIDLSACSVLSSIGDDAFYNNDLQYLDLSACSALNSIGDAAFINNAFSNIDFSNCSNLTSIGNYAFQDCYNMTNIELSSCSSLNYIGERAFFENPLTGFILPLNTEYYIYGWEDKEHNLYYASDTVHNMELYYFVPYPYTLVDNDVEVINGIIATCSYSFRHKKIIVPDTLDEQAIIGISGSDFSGEDITSIVLPSNIERIGTSVFANNRLDSMDFNGFSVLKYIGDGAFGMNNLLKINLSGCSSLTYIGNYAFDKNLLEYLDFSDCIFLDSIGENAFSENNLTNIDIDSSITLTYIGENAFSNNSIDIVNLSGCSALEFIGHCAFCFNQITQANLSGCSSLTKIDPGILYEIGDNSRIPLKTLDISNCSSITTIEDSYFVHGELRSLNLSGCTSLRKIENAAFFDNYLTGIDFSSCTALLYIGRGAFDENNFSSFKLPTPEIPGLRFRCWNDDKFVEHAGGEIVSDMNSYYEALFWDDDPTTVENISHLNENIFNLYPNPAKDIVHLQIEKDAIVSIVDIMGRIILMQIIRRGYSRISVAHIIPGSYIFKIELENKIYTEKVMIE